MVKAIADLHGADIKVDSQVGEGSTFSVSFPKDFPEKRFSNVPLMFGVYNRDEIQGNTLTLRRNHQKKKNSHYCSRQRRNRFAERNRHLRGGTPRRSRGDFEGRRLSLRPSGR